MMKESAESIRRLTARYNAMSNVYGIVSFAGAVLTIGFAGGTGWCWQTIISCIVTLLCAFLCADADASARYWQIKGEQYEAGK